MNTHIFMSDEESTQRALTPLNSDSPIITLLPPDSEEASPDENQIHFKLGTSYIQSAISHIAFRNPRSHDLLLSNQGKW